MRIKELLAKLEKSGGGGYQNLLMALTELRKGNARFSDLTLEHSFSLLNNHAGKLGQQYYVVLEELFYAALDVQYVGLAEV